MQKPKKPAPAKKAQTGKSKHARTRKPLTQEQRDRKNLRERERRAKLREEELSNAGKSCKQVKAVKDNPKFVAKEGCNGCGRKCGDKCKVNQDMTPESVFKGIAEAVQKAKFRQEEPGVIGCEFAIPGGGKAFVHFVDLSEIDPLSRFSPLPSQLRHTLLLSRMAREISDIVDRNIGMLG